MSELSDKLRSLGVQIGAQDIQPPARRRTHPIEEIIDGRFIETPRGLAFQVEEFYPFHQNHGNERLSFQPPSAVISNWMRAPLFHENSPHSYIFLDTETSGLAGGTGTYVFLTGLGRYDENGFRLTQLFLRDPSEEPAYLAGLDSALVGCQSLVTFNGKAFDIPLIQTRFIANEETFPLQSVTHLDLLPLARKLWKDRLPSRALGFLEAQILGVSRSQEDVPGWLIPDLYFDYLRTGDARPLKSIFYHNAMDILSMAALLSHMTRLLDDPHIGTVEHALDLLAIGKLFEDIGDVDAAARCYAEGLECDLPEGNRSAFLQRWSILEKRRLNLEAAIQIWREAAAQQDLYAFVELAKIYEHRLRDLSEAIYFTSGALQTVETISLSSMERDRWIVELNHRLERLNRKQASAARHRLGNASK